MKRGQFAALTADNMPYQASEMVQLSMSDDLTEVTSESTPCRASQYANLNDTYEGSALCGCLDCIEYTAERDSEDEA